MDEVKKVDFASVRDKMAGLLPMSNDAVWEFTPDSYDDIPDEFKPIFKIRQFKMSQVDDIKSVMSGKTKLSEAKTNEKFLDHLHTIFAGWDNLYNLATGELFPYDGTKECMLKIPQFVLLRIFQESLVVGGIMPRQYINALMGRND